MRDYIYPSLQSPPPGLSFVDQFVFQPTGSTTAALIQLLQTVTTLLETNPYVIVYALDFSKAFDSVCHSQLLEKFSRLKLPDNVFNWIESFFRDHSHCTIIQGSGAGPASYVVTVAAYTQLLRATRWSSTRTIRTSLYPLPMYSRALPRLRMLKIGLASTTSH